MTDRLAHVLIALGALLLAAATALGALASHGLASLDAASMSAFQTAVDYQLVHSLGLIAIAIFAERHPEARELAAAGLVLLAGIVLFCGGVYASSLGGPSWIAGLAPAGGIGLIVGWIAVAGSAAWRFASKRG